MALATSRILADGEAARQAVEAAVAVTAGASSPRPPPPRPQLQAPAGTAKVPPPPPPPAQQPQPQRPQPHMLPPLTPQQAAAQVQQQVTDRSTLSG